MREVLIPVLILACLQVAAASGVSQRANELPWTLFVSWHIMRVVASSGLAGVQYFVSDCLLLAPSKAFVVAFFGSTKVRL